MQCQKVSISLPSETVAFIEYYQALRDCASRSQVISEALTLLQSRELENAYGETSSEMDEDWEVTKVYPFKIFLSPRDSDLPKPSKIQAQQIRTISKQRIDVKAIACLNSSLMETVEIAMRLHLALGAGGGKIVTLNSSTSETQSG